MEAGGRWLAETGRGRSEGGKNGMVDGDSTVRGRNMQRRRRGMSEVGGNVRGIGCKYAKQTGRRMGGRGRKRKRGKWKG
jgi:hypothetical protein